MACEVHDGEEQVAELLELRGRARSRRRARPVPRRSWRAARRVGPVEADARGAALELGRAFERRKRQRNARERAFIEVGLAFLGLDVFPQVMAAMLGVAEDVRMPALHLVADAVDHVLEREMAGFLGHARMEDDLELQIAKLVGERVHVVARDRVGDLIGFLDRIGRDGLEGLDAVPFAAAHRIAQPAHDLDQPLKRHEGPLRSLQRTPKV